MTGLIANEATLASSLVRWWDTGCLSGQFNYKGEFCLPAEMGVLRGRAGDSHQGCIV